MPHPASVFNTRFALVMLSVAGCAPLAQASCGSAYCLLNTGFEAQGAQSQAGQWRWDVHYETINQNQLREGTHNISAAQDSDEEAIETGTKNRNLTNMLDYTFDAHWGVAATLPFVDRDHKHIADPQGTPENERWQFSELADARVIGRYQFDRSADSEGVWGVQFGAKLATGKTDISNRAGVTAERALQPGTGSNDMIIGAYYAEHKPMQSVSYFAQLQYQRAVSSKDNFRPGNQISFSAGLSYPWSQTSSVMLQLNGQQKQRDSGANAEPDVSGGRYVYISPGISYALSNATQVYAFWQQPLYRDVNGIQLTAAHAFVAGFSARF